MKNFKHQFYVPILGFLIVATGCGHAQKVDNSACEPEIVPIELCVDRFLMQKYSQGIPGAHLGDPTGAFESVNRPETLTALETFRERIKNEKFNPDEFIYTASVSASSIYLEANPRVAVSGIEFQKLNDEAIQVPQTAPSFHALFKPSGEKLIEFDFQR